MSLANQHSAQLLNYLLLLNASHGKLINFREPKVESRFVNTKLTAAKQRTFDVFTDRWIEEDETTRALRMRMLEIAEDWGCFLELPLYLEALIYFFGGEGNVVHKLPLYRCGLFLGNQCVHLLKPDVAFRITAIRESAERHEHHLRAILNLSGLQAIQWINIARHRIEFVTLMKSAK
jgi:hypothetical protein